MVRKLSELIQISNFLTKKLYNVHVSGVFSISELCILGELCISGDENMILRKKMATVSLPSRLYQSLKYYCNELTMRFVPAGTYLIQSQSQTLFQTIQNSKLIRGVNFHEILGFNLCSN